MVKLGGSDKKRVSPVVHYCEKHGVLNKSADVREKASEIAKDPQWLRTD
jgi:hypothetical protein